MLVIPPPMSNAERQRRFQAAHPGYDRRRKARQRGMMKRATAQYLAALASRTAAADTEAKPRVLMLPAPVENPVLAELDALAASLAASRGPQPLGVLRGSVGSDPSAAA